LARRASSGSIEDDRSLPNPARRIELTKLSGRASRPSTAARFVPAWRRARSSAADSKAQRRYSRETSRCGGEAGKRSIPSSRSEKPAKEKLPDSPSGGPAVCWATWSTGS